MLVNTVFGGVLPPAVRVDEGMVVPEYNDGVFGDPVFVGKREE